jgi:WD40 repeat protein
MNSKQYLCILFIPASFLLILNIYGCHGILDTDNTPIPPDTPQYLSIISISDRALRIEWSKRDDYGNTYYEVERADSNQLFNQIGTTNILTPFYIDSAINRSKLYSYRVRAVRDTFISPYSDIIKVEYGLSNQLLRTLQTGGQILRILITTDGKYLVSSGGDSTINIWETSSWSLSRPTIGGNLGSSDALALTPDSKYVIIGGTTNIIIRKLSDCSLVRTINTDSASSVSLAVTTDMSLLVSADNRGKLNLYQYDNGSFLQTLDSMKYDSWDVAINPNSNILIAGSYQYLSQWDLNQRSLQKKINGSFLGLAFNKEGTILAVNASDVLTNYRVSDWTIIYSFGKYGYSTTFSPDGSLQLIGDKNSICIIDVSHGNVIQTLAAHTDVVDALAFFPDGKTFASGSWDTTIKVWSLSLTEQWHAIQ